MENSNKKMITLSFMITGILAWLIVKVLITTAAGMVSGKAAQMLNTDMALHFVPVLWGVAVFAILQMSPKIVAWADEVVSELMRIVWPSRKDTTAMTIVVCVMLLICGFIIGGFDIISSYAIDALLNLNLTV
jgi:preprotein translocase subunit SecE